MHLPCFLLAKFSVGMFRQFGYLIFGCFQILSGCPTSAPGKSHHVRMASWLGDIGLAGKWRISRKASPACSDPMEQFAGSRRGKLRNQGSTMGQTSKMRNDYGCLFYTYPDDSRPAHSPI